MLYRLLLLFSLVPVALCAQTTSGPEARVLALCRQSEQLRDSSLVRALELATDARHTADSAGWKAGTALALQRIGQCYDAVRRRNDAVRYYQLARAAARGAHNDSLLLHATYDLAEAYSKAQLHDSSLRYKLEALALARRLGEGMTEVQLLNFIGGFHFDLGHDADALLWWQRCLAQVQARHYRLGEPMVRNNLAEAYLRVHQTDSALAELYHARQLLRALPPQSTEAYVLLTLANAHRALHSDSAFVYARQALAQGRAFADAGLSQKAEQLLSELYSASGQAAEALRYYRAFISTRDSSTHEAQTAEEAWQLLRFDFDQALSGLETKQALFEGRQRRSRGLLWLTLGGLALVSLLSVGLAVILRQNRRRAAVIRRQAEVLQKQTDELQALLGEKELLIREVHHRVKNNLQVISGLLQLQSTRSAEASVKAALDDTQNRVLSIAFIHHNLYRNGDLGTVEIASFLRELIGHLEAVYAAHPVRIDLDVPPLQLDIDTAVPLGLVINELLTNSFKYAVATAGGSIRMQIGRTAAGHYALHYQDSGPGLPDGIDTAQSRSLGLRLVQQLARQLGGTVTYAGQPRNHVHFTFKDAAARGAENDSLS